MYYGITLRIMIRDSYYSSPTWIMNDKNKRRTGTGTRCKDIINTSIIYNLYAQYLRTFLHTAHIRKEEEMHCVLVLLVFNGQQSTVNSQQSTLRVSVKRSVWFLFFLPFCFNTAFCFVVTTTTTARERDPLPIHLSMHNPTTSIHSSWAITSAHMDTYMCSDSNLACTEETWLAEHKMHWLRIYTILHCLEYVHNKQIRYRSKCKEILGDNEPRSNVQSSLEK